MGRSQAVRQRVLVPRSQVRILAPQPSKRDHHARHHRCSRRDGRRPRHPDALRRAEALPSDPRPPHGRLGDRDRARDRRRARWSSSLRPPRATSSPTSGVTVAVQEPPLGTGDAVRAARGRARGHDGDVLVLSGDTPLLTAELLGELIATHRREGAAATILSAEPPDPRLYGRIVRDADGAVLRIAEGTDATPRSSRSARSTRRSTSFAATRSGRRSRSSSRRTCRASCTSPM